jgi:orsellinic acid C2-O-methyltransferase
MDKPMTLIHEKEKAEATDLASRMWRMVTSNWMTQAIYVAAELRLADLLADAPKTSQELAGATGTHAPSLQRLLRALVTLEICKEREDGSFELTPLGALLRSDAADSMRTWVLYAGGQQWPLWGHLLDSIKTGKTARELMTGEGLFENVERDPAAAVLFNQAMVQMTRRISQGVVRSYDYSRFQTIIDVGGGYGELLAAILQANPGTRGVLFDLPNARETGLSHIASMGLAERCEIVTGSFFESIPSDGDAYILKHIIHDWTDEQCKGILDNCRRVMEADGKLLVIERIIPNRVEPSVTHQLILRADLNMLIGTGGRERTESEFHTLLSSAGFRLNRVIEIGQSYNIIEAILAQ